MANDARTCLDSPARKKDLRKAVGLYPCHNQGGNQVKETFHLSEENGHVYLTTRMPTTIFIFLVRIKFFFISRNAGRIPFLI